MKAGEKWLLGGLLATGAGVGLFFWWRRKGPSVELPVQSFSLPQSFVEAPPFFRPTPTPPCTCANGFTPILQPDGSCLCSPVSIEVLGWEGAKCRTDAVCAPGLVCINGECRPASEWS